MTCSDAAQPGPDATSTDHPNEYTADLEYGTTRVRLMRHEADHYTVSFTNERASYLAHLTMADTRRLASMFVAAHGLTHRERLFE